MPMIRQIFSSFFKANTRPLPTPGRQLLTCGAILLTFFLVDYLFLSTHSLSDAEKGFLTRLGTLLTVVAGVVAGMAVFWDQNAKEIVEESAEQTFKASGNLRALDNSVAKLQPTHSVQIGKYASELQAAADEKARSQAYNSKDRKRWMGYFALVLLVVGGILLIAGAVPTRNPATPDGAVGTCCLKETK